MNMFSICAILILFSFSARSENEKPSIDKNAVKLVIRKNLDIFKKCYNDEYKKDNTIEGKVSIGWDINDQGDVSKSWIKLTKMNNKNVEDCLVDKVKSLKFPKAPTGTIAEVVYPFVFKGTK